MTRGFLLVFILVVFLYIFLFINTDIYINKIVAMKQSIIITLTVVAFFACKKEDPTTLTQELAKNEWQKTSILVSTDSIAPDTIPTIAVIPADCKKDNIWRFDATANTFQLLEGATKCNISDPDIKDEGTIEEQDNGSKLKVDDGGTAEIWEIESRSASSFRVSYFGRNSSNKLVKFRVVFTKI